MRPPTIATPTWAEICLPTDAGPAASVIAVLPLGLVESTEDFSLPSDWIAAAKAEYTLGIAVRRWHNAESARVYDFHSLTVYTQYRYQQLALGLAASRLPGEVTVDHFCRLAELLGYSAQWTSVLDGGTVEALRRAWTDDVRAQVGSRFEALADHYTRRLDTLPVTRL